MQALKRCTNSMSSGTRCDNFTKPTGNSNMFIGNVNTKCDIALVHGYAHKVHQYIVVGIRWNNHNFGRKPAG